MKNNEIVLLRANIIGGMDAHIRDVIGDDNITEIWLTDGMPDGEDEETLMNDMEDEDTFEDWVACFKHCLYIARRGE